MVRCLIFVGVAMPSAPSPAAEPGKSTMEPMTGKVEAAQPQLACKFVRAADSRIPRKSCDYADTKDKSQHPKEVEIAPALPSTGGY